MSPRFEVTMAKTGHAEGGWSLRAVDRGGETYCGISRKNNPDWRGWLIIDGHKAAADFPHCLGMDTELQRLVREFYLATWARLRCASMPTQELADVIFDTAFICGETTAGIYLQRALNGLNKRGTLWPDIEVDGKIGPVTLGMLAKASGDINLIITAAIVIRGYAHLALAERHPDQEDNARGWFNRLIEFLPKGVQ